MPTTHPPAAPHDAPDVPHDVPDGVTDVLLWRLAAQVQAVHQPHPDQPGRCASLLCAHDAYPCPPARAARRAQQLTRQPTTPPPAPTRPPTVVGRATVVRHRHPSWFTPATSHHRHPATMPPPVLTPPDRRFGAPGGQRPTYPPPRPAPTDRLSRPPTAAVA